MATVSATIVGAVPVSDAARQTAATQLLEWLEDFSENLKGRTNAVADEVQQIVEAMDTVELNLQNTFNSFRRLSSSQFVENHVYEEDETDLVTPGMSKKYTNRPSMPTESYEDEILPRYKDAVAFAWAAFERGGRQDDQRTVQPGSRNKVRDPHHGERIQILPHIIGSEEFTRDIHCGLADLRQWQLDPESDTEVESVRADLAAEPSGSGILSEGDISGTDSDAFDSQEEGTEPAVSAALDFKAMLEAALRNPSLPYDGNTSNDALYGEFTDNRFSLHNLNDDNLNSPRTISTMVDIIGRTMSTMDESKEKLRDSSSLRNANVDSPQLPLATESLQILEDRTPSSAVEELLRQPPNSVTQAMLNQEFKLYIDSNIGNRQVGTGDLGHVPIIPGGLFNDEARDTGFMTKQDSVVPNSNTGPTIPEGLFEEQDTGFMTREDSFVPNSNTGPTIPEGLFEEQLSLDPIQHKRAKSESSNSLLSAPQIQPLPLPSVHVVPESSSQDSESVLLIPERNQSRNFQSATKHASSSISSGSNLILGSQLTGLLPIRGGLFDEDEDDEDEDAGDLFGAPAPRVDSHAVLRPWASQSSKGLFDDIERDRETQSSDEAGSSQEGQRNSDVVSGLTSQNKGQSGHGALDLRNQPADNTISQSNSRSTHVDLVTSRGSQETMFNNQSHGKDIMQLPVRPTEAAAVRSSMPFIIESEDDTWSSSESELEDVVQGKTLSDDQPIQQYESMKVPSNDDSGVMEFQSIIAEGILDVMPESITPDTERPSETVSSVEPTHGEWEDPVSSSQTAPEVPAAGLPPAISRSSSSTETSPVKITVKPAETPLVLSKTDELSDAEASDSSDSTHSSNTSSDLHGIGQLQLLQNMSSSGTLTLPENLQPSTSEATGVVRVSPSSSPHNFGNKVISDDLSKVSNTSLPLPVKEVGRSTTRAFTPLFDDDDDDDNEDLFGHRSPNHQGALYPRTGRLGIASSSDMTLPISLGHGRIVETASPSTSQDVHTQLLPASNPSSDIQLPSQSTSDENQSGDRASEKSGWIVETASSSTSQDVHTQLPPASNPSSDIQLPSQSTSDENQSGDRASEKSGSNIASLLFGDDEDDEDALFGPLVGRTSRGSKSGKAGSIFGD